jgi:hypothetical protein
LPHPINKKMAHTLFNGRLIPDTYYFDEFIKSKIQGYVVEYNTEEFRLRKERHAKRYAKTLARISNPRARIMMNATGYYYTTNNSQRDHMFDDARTMIQQRSTEICELYMECRFGYPGIEGRDFNPAVKYWTSHYNGQVRTKMPVCYWDSEQFKEWNKMYIEWLMGCYGLKYILYVEDLDTGEKIICNESKCPDRKIAIWINGGYYFPPPQPQPPPQPPFYDVI